MSADTISSEKPPETLQDTLQTPQQEPLHPPHLSRSFDTSPATKREILGFSAIGWAYGGFDIAVVGVFGPILLQQSAAMAGFVTGQPNQPCPWESQKVYDCSIWFGSSQVSTTALPLYTICISVAFQVVLFLQLGPLADFGSHRKTLLLLFMILGGITACLFMAVPQNVWQAFCTMLILGNLFLGLSGVFNYSYLPLLTRYHPSVLKVEQENDALSPNWSHEQQLEYFKESDRVGNVISTQGFVCNFAGGFFCVLVCVLLVGLLPDTDLLSLQAAVTFVGLWWLVWTIVPALLLKPRKAPSIPGNPLFYGYQRFFKTFSHAKRLKNLFITLAAWFIIADCVFTISSSSVLVAQENIAASDFELVIVSIIVPVCAVPGGYIFLYLQRKAKLATRTMIYICIAWLLVIPIWVLVNFSYLWELYVLAAWYGLVVGAIQSFCRVLFSSMIPAGKESELFSLYEITDKGSSFLGPLIVGVIADKSGQLRNGFWYLLAMLLASCVILYFVDEESGQKEAILYRTRPDEGEGTITETIPDEVL